MEMSTNRKYIWREHLNKHQKAQVVTDIEELMFHDETVLLKGEAGAGKSSLAVKVVQQWTEGEILKNITCFLMLGAGSDNETSLCKIIWDDFPGAATLRGKFEDVFTCWRRKAALL